MTDAGLRSIGMHCHALTKLDISHAKMVTDVGISSLSTGCSNLRHVVFHGVSLVMAIWKIIFCWSCVCRFDGLTFLVVCDNFNAALIFPRSDHIRTNNC